MKTLQLFLLFIIAPILLFSQAAVVYDAKNDTNQAKQYLLGLKGFSEAEQQTQVLKDTYDFYKKAQETLSKVNRAVSDFFKIQQIVQNQIECIKLFGYYTSQARSFKNVSQTRVSSFTSTLSALNTNITQLVKHAELILRPDYFKMTDADRLKFLDDINNQMNDHKTIMTVKFKKLKADEDDAALTKLLNRE
jgi:hypothetical protein